MNHGQRQTTDVLWDSSELQWKISFAFSIFHFDFDRLKCSIYNRAKFTTDRQSLLLANVRPPFPSLCRSSRLDRIADLLVNRSSSISARRFLLGLFVGHAQSADRSLVQQFSSTFVRARTQLDQFAIVYSICLSSSRIMRVRSCSLCTNLGLICLETVHYFNPKRKNELICSSRSKNETSKRKKSEVMKRN